VGRGRTSGVRRSGLVRLALAALCPAAALAVPSHHSAAAEPTGGDGTWVDITPPGLLHEMSADPDKQYGFQTLRVAPSDPRVVYLGTTAQGIWRTTDGGVTWEKRNRWRPGDPGNCGDDRRHFLDSGRQAGLVVDPFDADIVWTTNLYGCNQGVFKSTDGGATWVQMLPESIRQRNGGNVSNLAIDPTDADHLLAGSRAAWNDGAVGFLETVDGGVSWIVHDNHPEFDQNNVFFIDSTTWLVGVLYNGFYRTEDAGQTWMKVSDVELSHGVATLVRVPNGTLYVSGSHNLQRSTDNGLSWESVAPNSPDEYMAVVHDGNYLITCPSNTGNNTADPDPPYYRSPVDDGLTWTPWPEPGILPNGPAMMDFDPIRRILYSANWAVGVFKLQL
jgi:photosystem II stability/assembly factor-like uncharacterized protein